MTKKPFPKVDPKQSFPALELDILKFWESEKIFERSVTREPAADKGEFRFFDGPPFATGLPHYGHILQGVIKDLIPRYKTMRGYRVPRIWGWDCHGLPVENLIEKELGLGSKTELEKFGIAKFNEACRDSVLRYAAEWQKTVARMGRWVDMEHDYKTMNPEFMEGVWWVFGELWRKGLIYEGLKPMHVCPRCVTPLSNFEVGLGYKEITDLSATVKFKVVGEENTYLLAWTTTPWTLPGNVALAVNPEVEYLIMHHAETKGGVVLMDESGQPKITNFIASRHFFAENFAEHGQFGLDYESKNYKKVSGSELVGLEYEPLFDYFADKKSEGAFRVVPADFVTTADGTGIVHIAPAFGEDDLTTAKTHDLPTIKHVTMEGCFIAEVTEWAGQSVKPADDPAKTDRKIVKWLEEHGKLFESKNYRHSYPHCWRCDTPLLNYATSSWFVSVEQLKDKLITNNQKISWTPSHVRDGRFGKWLEGARDWAISRNRYWGAPLPVWRCESCGEVECVSSVAELESKSGAKVPDLHKHFVDELRWPCAKCATKKTSLTVVRHGQTDWNVAPDRLQGHTDNPLNAVGREQAKEHATKIKAADFDLILTSPLLRARETAEILAAGHPVETSELLMEKDFGELEGLSFEQVFEKFPQFKTKADVRYRVDLPGGESHGQLLARLRKFLGEIQQKHAGKRILVVAHAVILRTLRYLVDGQEAGLDEDLPNCFTYTAELTPQMQRIPEVLDCWFESGSMPYAGSRGQGAGGSEESKNCELRTANCELPVPADFIAEAQDQTRGWFYTLHVLATALFDRPAFGNCICSGLVLAEDGQKMSKSKKNYPDPQKIFDSFGADAMRLYLMNSPVVSAQELRFSERGVEETLRSVLLPLWNTFYFFTTYANADGWIPQGAGGRGQGAGKIAANSGKIAANSLDLWILSELNILIREMTAALDAYQINAAVKPLAGFLDGLTNWFVRRSRRRFWKSESDSDKAAAYETLHFVLITVSQLLAPVCPFLAERIYRDLGGGESVHLAPWPVANEDLIDEKLSQEVAATRQIVSLGLAIRARENLKVRQPLASATIALPVESITMNWPSQLDTISEELNVKYVTFADNPDEIASTIVTVNARAAGPRLGGKIQQIIQMAKAGQFEITNEGVKIGEEILTGDEVTVGFIGKSGLAAESAGGIVVALDTHLTEELRLEGEARDLVRVVQELRKTAGYEVSDRIELQLVGAEKILANTELSEYLKAETLASRITNELQDPEAESKLEEIQIGVRRI